MQYMIMGIFALTPPYYYNPNIHNFGNVGFGGRIHAELAPFATKMIDTMCYNDRDIRKEILLPYENKKVLDLCCGTGTSTTSFGIGIDTSNEMLHVARRNNKNAEFYYGNAEYYMPNCKIDIVTCMFTLHEMPYFAQINTIKNAISIAKEEVVFVDISPNYTPSQTMLSGEPYILDYLSNIEKLMQKFKKIDYIKNHVTIWKLKNHQTE